MKQESLRNLHHNTIFCETEIVIKRDYFGAKNKIVLSMYEFI